MKSIIKEYGMLTVMLLIAGLSFFGLYAAVLPQLKSAAPQKETASNISGPMFEELASMQQPVIIIRPIHLKQGERKKAFSFLDSLINSEGKAEDLDFEEYQMSQGRCVYRKGESRIVIECEKMSTEGILESDREQTYSVSIDYRDSYCRKAKERATVLVTAHGAG
ncbi:hypothetical protein MCG98_04750 [Ruminococcus sp. OA3]|uniref:hypothetical protein n=1 Tax=Ruminococcus sp. OA3 TaxID=2914164 RepID=UPI001F05418B|nr:hypothetical protein [Ruminococcus sp. OA3]MCH1981880.1 hypothetical protein [Ruminococcus sp. OA3]